MSLRPTALLLLLLGLSGCGEEPAAVAPARDAVGEALAWLEGESGCADAARWLDHPALDDLLAMDEEAVQERFTSCLREGLQQGDLPTIQAGFRGLVRHFDGRGREGRGLLSAEAVEAATFEGALDVARRAMESDTPDRRAAEAALALAASLPGGGPDPERRRGVEHWVRLDHLQDAPFGLADHDGGRVVVWADDVLLGEPSRLGVLARWAEDGAAGGLRVGVVVNLSGRVRRGRRSQEAAPHAQARSIRERLTTTRILEEPQAVGPAWTREHLGLAGHEGALLVVARDGRVVARRAGSLDDLSSLETWVQKVGSR